jgi:hypothetical protein
MNDDDLKLSSYKNDLVNIFYVGNYYEPELSEQLGKTKHDAVVNGLYVDK